MWPEQGLPRLGIFWKPVKYEGYQHVRLKYCDLVVGADIEGLAPVLVDQKLPEVLIIEIP